MATWKTTDYYRRVRLSTCAWMQIWRSWACQTGNGRISPGEGLIGMSWAFFVAGARSVVVSQWRVNSHSTSQLMKNFYHALTSQIEQDNQNKSQALREASLRLLKDRRYRHPFYWAGFVLVSSN